MKRFDKYIGMNRASTSINNAKGQLLKAVNILNEVKEQMLKLGWISCKIRIKMIDEIICIVYLDGEQFGIYDFSKHTFVD